MIRSAVARASRSTPSMIEEFRRVCQGSPIQCRPGTGEAPPSCSGAPSSSTAPGTSSHGWSGSNPVHHRTDVTGTAVPSARSTWCPSAPVTRCGSRPDPAAADQRAQPRPDDRVTATTDGARHGGVLVGVEDPGEVDPPVRADPEDGLGQEPRPPRTGHGDLATGVGELEGELGRGVPATHAEDLAGRDVVGAVVVAGVQLLHGRVELRAGGRASRPVERAGGHHDLVRTDRAARGERPEARPVAGEPLHADPGLDRQPEVLRVVRRYRAISVRVGQPPGPSGKRRPGRLLKRRGVNSRRLSQRSSQLCPIGAASTTSTERSRSAARW